MKYRTLISALGLPLLFALAGCESGTEVAAVGSATATRSPDDRVVITAQLTCALMVGQPRLEGCDEDGTDVCLTAEWRHVDGRVEEPLFRNQHCSYQASIIDKVLVLTSSQPIPKLAPDGGEMSIVVYANAIRIDQRGNSTAVVIPNP